MSTISSTRSEFDRNFESNETINEGIESHMLCAGETVNDRTTKRSADDIPQESRSAGLFHTIEGKGYWREQIKNDRELPDLRVN